MTLVFVETDETGQVVLTSAEAVTFARTNAEALTALAAPLPAEQPSGHSATQGEVAQRPEGCSDESLRVEAAVIGALTEAATNQLAALGVDRIHHLEHPDLEAYSAAAWAQALVDIAPETGTVLASGTPRGMELMAHVAVRTGARMAANVVAADEGGACCGRCSAGRPSKGSSSTVTCRFSPSPVTPALRRRPLRRAPRCSTTNSTSRTMICELR
ncbi:hypothetical protein [Brevibacterium aurantiacum]|uniref:hypothetical protein n=1 Tax=Brevibacterium aurantiacum TaxID=273384 RepID=UPI000DF444C5|nr:hypothetical protein CIK63_17680 [Brevibacterium aurantiacum]